MPCYLQARPFRAESLTYAITEGHCVGSCERTSSEVVLDDKVEEALVALGNTGSFFDVELGRGG